MSRPTSLQRPPAEAEPPGTATRRNSITGRHGRSAGSGRPRRRVHRAGSSTPTACAIVYENAVDGCPPPPRDDIGRYAEHRRRRLRLSRRRRRARPTPPSPTPPDAGKPGATATPTPSTTQPAVSTFSIEASRPLDRAFKDLPSRLRPPPWTTAISAGLRGPHGEQRPRLRRRPVAPHRRRPKDDDVALYRRRPPRRPGPLGHRQRCNVGDDNLEAAMPPASTSTAGSTITNGLPPRSTSHFGVFRRARPTTAAPTTARFRPTARRRHASIAARSARPAPPAAVGRRPRPSLARRAIPDDLSAEVWFRDGEQRERRVRQHRAVAATPPPAAATCHAAVLITTTASNNGQWRRLVAAPTCGSTTARSSAPRTSAENCSSCWRRRPPG